MKDVIGLYLKPPEHAIVLRRMWCVPIRDGELHVILDNSSAHGTPEIRRRLSENPLVKFHFTPTSASWLNQVEGFVGILGKQSLFLNDFRSRKALAEHIRAYIKAWN